MAKNPIDKESDPKYAAAKEANQSQIDLLKQVNLVDFVVNKYGFTVNEARTKKENSNKDNPRSVYLEDKNGDKYLISRVPAGNGKGFVYLYRNFYNSNDKGSYIDFIKNRHSEPFKISYANKVMKDFEQNLEKGFYKPTGIDMNYPPGDLPKNIDERINEMALKYSGLPPYTHCEYLEGRGISKETLKNPILQEAIKNEPVYFLKSSATVKQQVKFMNTVFPIYTLEGKKSVVCGIVRKNTGMKQTMKGSVQSIGVWHSDFDRTRPVSHLVLSENPIDSISYMQMKMDTASQNPLLAASNGELTDGQVEIYQAIVTGLKPETIVLANDNNCKGQLFNAKILATLVPPDKFLDQEYIDKNKLIVNAKITCGYQDQQHGKISWTFHHSKIEDNMSKKDYVEQHMLQHQRVKEYYQQLNVDKVLINDEKAPFKEVKSNFHELYSEIEVSFFNTKENWKDINQSIVALKYDYAEQIKIEVSKHDDWNNDLKESLGIDLKEAKTQQVKGPEIQQEGQSKISL